MTGPEKVAAKFMDLANEATGQAIIFARQGSPEFARLRREDARSLRRLASEELRK